MSTPLTKPTASHKPYDICIVTAANEYQARGYREQFKRRMGKSALPEETEFLVFPDPQGKRIGSGGSTIYVLYKLLQHLHQSVSSTQHPTWRALKGKRILMLHSGGDSRRLPAYSAVGKIFTPLPTSLSKNGTDSFAALFDLLFENLMQLPRLRDGQVVVASGDVLLSFDASEVAFSDSGVTGLAYPGPVEVALNHGVYIVPQPFIPGEKLREVLNFLQKPTYDELKKANGLDIAERAFIDTGVMNFGIGAIEALMDASGISIEDGKVAVGKDTLCENLINGNGQLDIYREIAFAMLGKDGRGDGHRYMELLQQIPFFVNLLTYCEFFHVGTSRKLIQNFHAVNHTASIYGFQNFSRSKVMGEPSLGDAFVYNSLINAPAIRINDSALIESCSLEGEIQLEGENILTGVPKGVGDIKLQKGICVTCVPVSLTPSSPSSLAPTFHGWASVIYGIEDDFKKHAKDEAATFLNEAFLIWMKEKGILPSDLWADSEPHDLWNARLFPFSMCPAESVQIALSFQTDNWSLITHYSSRLSKWRKSLRMSLREILQSVDYGRFLDNYSNLYREVNLGNLATILTPKSDLSPEEILSWCTESGDYTMAAKTTLTLIEESKDVLFRARLHRLLSSILRKAHDLEQSEGQGIGSETSEVSSLKSQVSGYVPGKDSGFESWALSLEDGVFEFIREAIREGLKSASQVSSLKSQVSKIQIRSDEVVWVCAPARLDFAGGWSDTPPYCLEYGGSVLNAAVKLNGQYPIQVIGKLHPEPFIKINSIDLGEHIIVSETPEMLSYSDPSDWSALPKAAFVATGIMTEDAKLNLQDVLKELGSGIDLTLFSAVPAGSGLGTSSILGSAIIACLSRMLGQELAQEELFNRTLYMEQLITTGGGWQDQIGGVVGGVKLIQTEAGLFQTPRISWTDLKISPDMDLSERLLLYYTGYTRMAKNILRNIVAKYLDRDLATLRTIDRLRQKSLEMKEELDHRNINAFGKKIAEVWELNKALDPGTTNEDIEAILSRISPIAYGAKLLGAGGGGFLFIVTKGVEQGRRIRETLSENPPNNRARFFDFEIDPHGLEVSVL